VCLLLLLLVSPPITETVLLNILQFYELFHILLSL